ncbi:hypothetical protein JCM8097_006980 [Rhodosporidiobolus ruineniae]
MGKKPPQTLPTEKHSVPVASSISTPPTAPAPERNVQVRPLSTPTAKPPLPPQQVVVPKKKKRKNRDKDQERSGPNTGQPATGRIVLPASEANKQPQAGGSRGRAKASTYLKQPRSAQRAEHGALPGPSKLPPRPAAKQDPPPEDSFVEVAGPSGEITFTRTRSDRLNESISSILGPRKSDMVEQHDREVRTKRQKLFAEQFKQELLMDLDKDADKVGKDGEVDVDMDDDDDELLVTPVPVTPAALAKKVDLLDPAQVKSDFPPLKPFAYPAQSSPTASFAPPAFQFSFSPAAPAPSAPLPASSPTPPSAVLAEAPPSPTVDPKPFSDLPKALPLPAGAIPKSALHTPVSVLAGKKRKPKRNKLKRAPQLFDYLGEADEESVDEYEDDWEDVGGEKWWPKRPKDGRAVEGKLPSPEERDGAEGAEDDGKGKGKEKEKETEKERRRRDRDILPEARAHAEKLVPKSYQTALLERAKVGNVLTVLPTGSGKTLVAIGLIEWVHETIEKERQAAGRPKRIQLFLTNSVPLVHQQANGLAHNTPLRVGKLFGALGVNLCSEKEWEYNFEHFDVLVSTAQLILDSLAHGFIKMEQIALIVLDEVHHGKANHPFAAILRDFYHRAKSERPRILGLTASPIDSNQGLETARKLEMLFDAKLVTAPPKTRQELEQQVARPTVLTVEFDPSPPYERTKLYQDVLDRVIVQDEVFKRHLASAEAILHLYGPDASDLVWHLAYSRYRQKFIPLQPSSDESGGEGERKEDEMDDDSVAKTTMRRKKAEAKKERKRIRRELNAKRMEELELDLPEWMRAVEAHQPTLSYDRLSPKLKALIDHLKACEPGKERFCGIIFVSRRMDALIIAQIIKILAKTTPGLDWVKADCVTGHGTGPAGNLGPRMPWHEQASILTAFGEGDTNLLIATSVVEEGLDVQPCNFVVRFDLYHTHISFVQSRGRARAPGSHYLIFCERNNLEEKRKMLKVMRFDREINSFLAGELLAAELEDEDEDPQDFYGRADEELEYYEVESTGAVLTPHFALSLLGRYCHSLPKSDEFALRNALFDFVDKGCDEFGQSWWTCNIALPSGSKLRLIEGPLATSTKLAKRAAAFDACKILHRIGSLDDHLLPLRIFPPEDIVDSSGNAVGTRKNQVEYERAWWKGWQPDSPCGDSTVFHATLLHYGGDNGNTTVKGQLYRPVVLLSRNPLPPTPPTTLYVEGEPLVVHAAAVGAVSLTTEQRKLLTQHNLAMWRTVLNKEELRIAREVVDGKETLKELELVWFVAELLPDVQLEASRIKVDDLAWARMKHVKEVKLDWKNMPQDLADTVIVDLAKNGCRYFFQGVREDLHPESVLPKGRQSDKSRRIITLMDYYLSFNAPYFHSFHVDPAQPLLEVSRMSKSVTFLSKTPRNDCQANPKKLRQHLPHFALPQTALVHHLPASIFRTAYMLPSILTDLEQRLLVIELNEKLFGGQLDEEQLRISMLTPSAAVGIDYNRQELLGDSFLKYVCSTHLFAVNERTMHEGDLHRARLRIINNANLAIKAADAGIPAYLVSRPFTSRQFLPPNFENQNGQPPASSTVIGGKTIADSFEAILGAAIETGYMREGLQNGFDLALMVIKSLKLETDGVDVWPDFAFRYGSPDLQNGKMAVPEDFRPVEEVLGYRFQHGGLIKEAFTHPSVLNEVSFERFEWLGDAVLDYHVLRWAWNKRWGVDLSEGHLTEIKGGCVSNETLAALAVELGLDRFLRFDNDTLAINLRLYRDRVVRTRQEEVENAAKEGRQLRPYWLTLDAPKAVADIIESLFGALYVDSGFSPEAAQQAFDHMIVPFVERWITPTSLKVDAIRTLLERAQSNMCDDVSHVSSTLDPRTDSKTGELIPRLTRCSVVAHNLVLATCETGHAKTAKKIASYKALSYLEQNTGFFASVCDCPTRRAIAKEVAEERLQRLRDEGLVSEPDSSGDEPEKEVVLADGAVDGAGDAMAVDAT